MKINTLIVAALLWLLVTPLASAEQGGPGSTPWYTIEIVLFTRSTPADTDSEIWPKASGQLDWDGERTANYALAPATSLQLSSTKLALTKSHEALTPVIHAAWHQPVYRRNSARSFYLKSDREITPGTPLIEGMVKVSINRYLHVDLDLLMRGTPTGVDRLAGGFQTFRFAEHRRMRSRELHYIDHPLMGKLIQITPLDSASSQTSEDGDSKESAGDTKADEPAKTE